MDYIEKKTASKEIYKGRVITLQVDEIELPNGKPAIRELVRHNGGVAILAIDDNGNALFVRQFRYPYGQVLLELPAGKLEPGEDPAHCGMRELEEETGYRAGNFSFLGKAYPTPGYTDEVLHLYLATALEKTCQNLDEDEFLTAEKIPFERAVQMCLDGTIADAKTMIAILKYNEMLRRQ